MEYTTETLIAAYGASRGEDLVLERELGIRDRKICEAWLQAIEKGEIDFERIHAMADKEHAKHGLDTKAAIDIRDGLRSYLRSALKANPN